MPTFRKASVTPSSKGYFIGYVIFGMAIIALVGWPSYSLGNEFPDEADAYRRLYPGLFLFAFPLLPTCLFCLYGPIRSTALALRQAKGAAIFAVAFLVCTPAFVVFSERYKDWVAPWEVPPRAHVPDAGIFKTVEEYDVPSEWGNYTGRYVGPQTWMQKREWPAAFFFLVESSALLKEDNVLKEGNVPSNPMIKAREALRAKYWERFANRDLVQGRLPLSRTGFARYVAVGAIALVASFAMLAICLVFFECYRNPKYQVPRGTFHGLVGALLCFMLWLLMRTATSVVDEAVFRYSPAFDQWIPAIVTTVAGAAMAYVGMTEKVRGRLLNTFSLAGLILVPWIAQFNREQVPHLFEDLRLYGGLSLLLLLLVVGMFFSSARPPVAASNGP